MKKNKQYLAIIAALVLLVPDLGLAANAHLAGQNSAVVRRPSVPALNAGSSQLQTQMPEAGSDATAKSISGKKKSRKVRRSTDGRTTQQALPKPPVPGGAITLIDTVNGVLRHQREIRAAQEDREALKHELKRAKRAFGPRVDLEASAGTSVINDSSTRRHDLYYRFIGVVDLSARLTQPIWDGFATRSRVRRAQANLDASAYRIFDTATTLSLDGIIAQINLLRQRAIFDLAKKNVETHRQILGQTEDRAGMGADTEADVTQTKSRLSRALSTLSEAQSNLITAENTYERLTGLTPSEKIQSVPMPPLLFDKPKAVLDLAEKNNPRIHTYLEEIRGLQADKELAKSAFYPVLNFETGPSHTNHNRFDDRWTSTYEAVGRLRWNVFNSGMDVAEVDAAKARIRQSRQTLYNYLDNLMLDIQSTWTNYLAARDLYTNYTEAVEFNKLTCVAYQEQFYMGQRTLLDVLDAENELYNSATQAETAKGNILIGAYRLCALAGDLLPMLKVDVKPLDLNPERDPKDPRENFDLGWFK